MASSGCQTVKSTREQRSYFEYFKHSDRFAEVWFIRKI